MDNPFQDFPPEMFIPPVPARGRYSDVPMEHRRADLYYLAERDGWVCAYCQQGVLSVDGHFGVPGGPLATVDHVVARKWGGADTNRNAVVACGPCNSRKGDRVGIR